ncbi:acyl-CoA dehydrogenase [Parvularcula sp. ZS-1/3]|uniref:Acyl-CoA dehydrogenase n=1 Tax=Parvularcula mediterranea TaxID=2732508 RepID=A0A7Y3RIN2_9PROT|nr:acyl-CoA dehydrogenase family protein [Parvularcula mediterranea]NNU14747.1 acyl-CoA dehydrogenase [Parvularcula mediterranea]
MVMLTDEQQMIVETAAGFTADRLRPNAACWEEEKSLSREVLRELGELGFGGIYVREDIGGSALSRLDAVLIFEELSKGCVSHATFLSIHNMCAWMVDSFGSEHLRQTFGTRMTSCELIGSYCLTEPGSGSDAASLKTSAKKDGDEYVLNGSKVFISGAGFSDVYIVMARTGDVGPKGVSCFLVEKDTPGLSFGKNEKKMGWSAQPTRMVMFDDCRIPVANRLGEEGDGFTFAMKGLDGGRLNIAAASLGGAQEATDRAIAYGQDREQFGARITDFQATQFKLADMATEIEAARQLLYSAARKLDAGDPGASSACAMAKRFVTDMGSKVANDALQIHGGYGYLAEYEVERIVRDLRVHQILEGTNEVMRVIISRKLLSDNRR